MGAVRVDASAATPWPSHLRARYLRPTDNLHYLGLRGLTLALAVPLAVHLFGRMTGLPTATRGALSGLLAVGLLQLASYLLVGPSPSVPAVALDGLASAALAIAAQLHAMREVPVTRAGGTPSPR